MNRRLPPTLCILIIGITFLALSGSAWAAGGTCANFAAGVCPSGPYAVTTGVTNFYFVSTSGSDSNSGTTEASPLAHVPGMVSYRGSITPSAGMGFILRGCDDWGNSNFNIHWTWSGTSTNHIYIGVDPGWYNTTNCPSRWNRPVFDAQGTDIRTACGGAGIGTNYFVYLDTVTYVDWNWIEG